MSFKIAKFSIKSTLTAQLEVETPMYHFDLVLLFVNCALVTLFYEVVKTLCNQILLEGNVEGTLKFFTLLVFMEIVGPQWREFTK